MSIQHRQGERKTFALVSLIRTTLIVAATCGMLWPLSCARSLAADGIPDQPFSIAADSDFKGYAETVKQFARRHRLKGINDFCIVGYSAADRSRYAWVIWRQGQKIILWDAGDADLDLSRRQIDMKKDVVGSDRELQGSTYLVTRAWVDDLIAACNRDGAQVHLEMPGKPSGR